MKKAHAKSLEQAEFLASEIGRMADVRLDADETNMLALQLEDLRTKVYQQVYPRLKARAILPVANDIDPDAESHAWVEEDWAGEAKVIRNHTEDAPSAEVKRTKVTGPIVELGDTIRYSVQDIARAAKAGTPLVSRKLLAARAAFERGLERIAALGSSEDGISTGLLNKTIGTGSSNIRGTAMTSAAWVRSTVDPVQMVDDLNNAVSNMVDASAEAYEPNLLLLSTANYQTLKQTRMSPLSSETALEAFLRANPEITDVRPWNLLKTIDGSSGNNARGMLMYKSPEVAELILPKDFLVLPPQPKGYGFVVPAYGRTGGTAIYAPLGCHYLSAMPVDPAA